MAYGILLHELPVSINNEGTMKNSVLHEIFCKSLFRTSRPIVKYTGESKSIIFGLSL